MSAFDKRTTAEHDMMKIIFTDAETVTVTSSKYVVNISGMIGAD